MTFAPILPATGLSGWAFLKRTEQAQSAAFAAQSSVKRDEAYFRDNIGKIDTAEQLVKDRRLLKIALEAYGLGNDIDNRYFIQRVLQDGTLKTGALANKLADKQYVAFSAAFGFGDFSTPRNKLSDFSDKILSRWRERSFESAVGEQDNSLRMAMNARRELADIAAGTGSENTKWYKILGNAPLRKVVQGALGLPASFAALDLDKQLVMIKDKTAARYGAETVSQFSDATKVEDVIRRFLARNSAESTSASTNTSVVLMSASVNFLRRV